MVEFAHDADFFCEGFHCSVGFLFCLEWGEGVNGELRRELKEEKANVSFRDLFKTFTAQGVPT